MLYMDIKNENFIKKIIINEYFINLLLMPVILLGISLSLYKNFTPICILVVFLGINLLSFCEIKIDERKNGNTGKTKIELLFKIFMIRIIPLVICDLTLIVIQKKHNYYVSGYPIVEIIEIVFFVISFFLVLAILNICDDKSENLFFYINLLLFVLFLVIGIKTVYCNKLIISFCILILIVTIPFFSLVFYGIKYIKNKINKK